MKKNIPIFILLTIIIQFMIACAGNGNGEKDEMLFESDKWKVGHTGGTLGNDIEPFREKMLYDLIRNYKLHSLNEQQLYSLLGTPDHPINSNNIVVYWLDEELKPFSADMLWQKELHVEFDKERKEVISLKVIQRWDTI